MVLDQDAAITRKSSGRRRALIGGILGNAFEAYDTAVYGYLAVIMGHTFFPAADARVQLLSSLALFGVTFFMRPLGALVFGPLADRFGRTRVLVWMIVMMAASTALIGVLPDYRAAGLFATAALVLLRLVQGLAVGGEFGTATSFLTEFARPGRRGFATSWYIFSSLSGFLLGAIVVTVFSAGLSPASMAGWGWRVVFLIAAPLGLLAVFVRLKVQESPEFEDLLDRGRSSQAPLREGFRHYPALLIAVGVGILHSVAFYMAFSYAATYIQSSSKLSAGTTFGATVVAGVLGLIVLPLAGLASDRWGRRAVLAVGGVWNLVVAYPAFILMSSGTAVDAFVGQALLGVGVGLFLSTSTAAMAELFPTRLRATGSAVSYNLAAALFGGTAPFIAQLLVTLTGNQRSPAVYLMAASVIGLVATALITRRRLHVEVS
jgi:MFS transporter, MHS family, proline/betaine transporter